MAKKKKVPGKIAMLNEAKSKEFKGKALPKIKHPKTTEKMGGKGGKMMSVKSAMPKKKKKM